MPSEHEQAVLGGSCATLGQNHDRMVHRSVRQAIEPGAQNGLPASANLWRCR